MVNRTDEAGLNNHLHAVKNADSDTSQILAFLSGEGRRSAHLSRRGCGLAFVCSTADSDISSSSRALRYRDSCLGAQDQIIPTSACFLPAAPRRAEHPVSDLFPLYDQSTVSLPLHMALSWRRVQLHLIMMMTGQV